MSADDCTIIFRVFSLVTSHFVDSSNFLSYLGSGLAELFMCLVPHFRDF